MQDRNDVPGKPSKIEPTEKPPRKGTMDEKVKNKTKFELARRGVPTVTVILLTLLGLSGALLLFVVCYEWRYGVLVSYQDSKLFNL